MERQGKKTQRQKGTELPLRERRRPEDLRKDMRDAFAIDCDRILHSAAYTSYIDKTQVFSLISHQGISHRVIHVQLLSRIARTIGRRLGLNDDLIEAIAIGHDIGHPPFGHDGENYLDALCRTAGIGLFAHNVQGVWTLERIEKNGKGLNLSLAVLDGILCHNGETTEQGIEPDNAGSFHELDNKIISCLDGKIPRPATMEGCLVRFVDTVSYIGRDIEDAILLGIISRRDIPKEAASILGDTNGKIVYSLVEDLIANSSDKMISYSPDVFSVLRILKEFNYKNIYLNPRVKLESEKIGGMYSLVFERLVSDLEKGNALSSVIEKFVSCIGKGYKDGLSHAEIARDYIAGLTDTAFLRLFSEMYIPQRRQESC
jgi:dGTPase